MADIKQITVNNVTYDLKDTEARATMTGATSSADGAAGRVPAPTTTDVDHFLAGDGTWKAGGKPMVILSYGSSVWNDFIEAYNNHVIVYCRASSNSNPATGSQTRMAFMAYVNNATTPTEVEFQYYRSVSSHSATQMGDQVFVYKLTNKNAWTVTTREASIKTISAASGSKIGVSWSNNAVTLTNTMTASDMPMSSSDSTVVSAVLDEKADKVQNATTGNFASLDANGNLTDSGHSHSDYIPSSQKGSASGVAELDSSGHVPSSQLPSYVDDVVEYDTLSEFPATGESGKIYIAKDMNITYRWGGSSYVAIGSDLALGETSSTAYRGDRGKTAYDHATDSGRVTTATSSGLYKISITNEGHVGSATAVVKSDITALGIPGSAQEIISEIPTMTGATVSEDGAEGLVPAPTTADKDKFLRGDGTWAEGGGDDYLSKHCDIGKTQWDKKTWNGYSNIVSIYIWTDGDNFYYSNSSNQYVLDKSTSTWNAKTWTGLTNINGGNIWTDGDNIYYSNSSNQYVLDKSTSTWSTKTWNELTSFNGSYVWTDGDNIYYSNNSSNQYVLDKATSTWNAKTWNGLTILNCENIWTDGDNIYYSNYSNQYVLDKATSTWNTKTWTGLTNFYASSVWTDGTNIYYSNYSEHYVLDKSTYTWNVVTWDGLEHFYGHDIWTDGDNIYCSSYSNQCRLTSPTSVHISIDGEDYKSVKCNDYFVFKSQGSSNAGKYMKVNDEGIIVPLEAAEKIDKYYVNSGWNAITWTGNEREINGEYIWTDGNNIYYSYWTNYQYVLNKSTHSWSIKTWNGLTSFYGNDVWTDGDNVYYSNSSNQYVLDKATSTWSTKTWTGLTSFNGNNVWTDGDNVYYSNSSNQYVLDKSTSTWSTKTWTRLTSFNGNNVWTDGDNVYYSYGENYQYVLDKATSTWNFKSWPGFSEIMGDDVWTDGDNYYYSNYTSQYVLDKDISMWESMTWNLSRIDGYRIWTDGEHIYYSSGANQYVFVSSSDQIYLGKNGEFNFVDAEKYISEVIASRIVFSSTEPTNPTAGTIWLQPKEA